MEKILKKELERQRRFTEDILAGMIDLVRVIDKNGRVIFINKPMKDFLGDITGTICFKALGKTRRCEVCISQKTIKEGIIVKKEEVIGDKIFSVISSPIRDENGNIYCSVEVFRDITEKKKMENIILSQNLKMKRDINFAKNIQNKILPKDGIYNDAVKICSKYIPCEMLGGDVFDIINIDEENIGIYIADVAGHGVTASIMTMFIKQAIKNLGKKAKDPEYTLSYLNLRYNELGLDDHYYVTIFYGVYNKTTREITLANGGQNSTPIVIRKDGIEEIFLSGLPICTLFREFRYTEKKVKLEKGERILFYTDGIIEAKNKRGKLYGDRILNVCMENLNSSSEEIIEKVLKNVMDFSDGNIDDDIAIMMMEVI
ncbi:SpoIIE family protein phosphatase [Caminicella sporogenes]|uniref:SpoIIE family protein phosphatase n=1 Tax=Caminicella sporogenes TaxID=166485 RepID=UPI0025409584|nr:SpoIIE family protein phosphatase [Caminicella sporogenes]WIF95848.1 SpoIIE family protein phosphatase [Caminicella sporogenes]